MDVGLGQYRQGFRLADTFIVLILVLVDVGLGRCFHTANEPCGAVLILVLVDVGLGHVDYIDSTYIRKQS